MIYGLKECGQPWKVDTLGRVSEGKLERREAEKVRNVRTVE